MSCIKRCIAVFSWWLLSTIVQAGAVIEVVGEPAFDFGDFAAGNEQKTVFRFKNSGDSVLVINKIRVTCGCSEVVLDKTELEPNEIGVVSAGLKAHSLSGGFSKSFYLISNADNKMLQRFVMTGNAVVDNPE